MLDHPKYHISWIIGSLITISLFIRLFSLGSTDLLVEEAYYWNYAEHLDFGYLDHPPMVALLIKISTLLFGTNECAVRIPSFFCWLLTCFFSFKLTTLISKKAGPYAILLLSILPFFFLHALIITPDQPLIVCWSATLYYLYRALILNRTQAWYLAGLWLGLGLLSKYTIGLLVLTTFFYLCYIPTARNWFLRKEPYLAVLFATLLFTPVLYWNATHDWISLTFQTTRRLQDTVRFSFHQFLGLTLFFLMPAGIIGLWDLTRPGQKNADTLEQNKRFLKIYTIIPLLFFGVYSLAHGLKFNWIGPLFLALVPWLALLIEQKKQARTHWIITGILLLTCYGAALWVLDFSKPPLLYKRFFSKFIAWQRFTLQIHQIADSIAATTHTKPIIVPLDLYNIGSELTFYQEKLLTHHDIVQSYQIVGRHVFGESSLMYQFWAPKDSVSGQTVLLVSKDAHDFQNEILKATTLTASPLRVIWAESQVTGTPITPYYYQVVRLKK